MRKTVGPSCVSVSSLVMLVQVGVVEVVAVTAVGGGGGGGSGNCCWWWWWWW